MNKGREADATTHVAADPESVFAFLDDQTNLSSHMSKPSAMMLGSAMAIHMDEDHTRRVGSRFGFEGRIFGIPLRVEEIVTARQPPRSKSWETTAEPVLWVIGSYTMRFDLAPEANGSSLRVHIAYDPPRAGLPRLLAGLFGRLYARWCVRQMTSDAQRHFEKLRAAL